MKAVVETVGMLLQAGLSAWLSIYFWLWLWGVNGEPSGRMQTALLLIAASYAVAAHLLLRVQSAKEGR